MAPIREEVVLFTLVLLALGLVAFGVLDLIWPRPDRAHRRRRLARVEPPPAAVHEPAPPRVTPAIPPPVEIATVEAWIERAADLTEFPLRALVVLRRADEQAGRLSGDSVRIEALRDRLNAQYAEVGCRLFASGLSEQAVALLTRALGRNTLRGEALQRVREALAGALAHIAEQRGQTIRTLAQEGNAATAIAHADRLVALIRAAIDVGLTETDLTAALAASQRVFAHLGVHRFVAAR